MTVINTLGGAGVTRREIIRESASAAAHAVRKGFVLTLLLAIPRCAMWFISEFCSQSGQKLLGELPLSLSDPALRTGNLLVTNARCQMVRRGPALINFNGTAVNCTALAAGVPSVQAAAGPAAGPAASLNINQAGPLGAAESAPAGALLSCGSYPMRNAMVSVNLSCIATGLEVLIVSEVETLLACSGAELGSFCHSPIV